MTKSAEKAQDNPLSAENCNKRMKAQAQKQAHTPEPWLVDDNKYQVYHQQSDRITATCDGDNFNHNETDYANAQRIVDCVNACADMNDPKLAIKQLKDALLHARGQELRDYAPRQRNIDLYEKALKLAGEVL